MAMDSKNIKKESPSSIDDPGSVVPNIDQEAQSIRDDLTKEIQAIGSLKLEDGDFVKTNQVRSKFVFGLMMRSQFRKQTGDKFQPCQDEIDLLRSMPKAVALCYDLRRASLTEFCSILHPTGGKDGLDDKDTIFHVHELPSRDIKEFKDLSKRAEVLGKVISELPSNGNKIKVHLLDGHGRMLVCLLRALDRHSALEQVDSIRLFEIDKVVHEYHKLAIPDSIEKLHHTVIDHREIPYSGVIYLNFCSIPSMAEYDWTPHFEDQTIDNWVYGCCKENVLKYIWKAVNPPYSCTVMVSCVIKGKKKGRNLEKKKIFFLPFRKTLGNYVTGLGLFYLLRQKDLFNAEIVSIRPDSDEFQWDADDKDKREPLGVRSGEYGYPFVTLMVKPPVQAAAADNATSVDLKTKFKNNEIADLREEDYQRGARVKVTKGNYKGKTGKIKGRTVAMAYIEFDTEDENTEDENTEDENTEDENTEDELTEDELTEKKKEKRLYISSITKEIKENDPQ